MFGEFTDSPYGSFSPEMPIFSFGKIAEKENFSKKFAKKDLALSLIARTANTIAIDCIRICSIRDVKKVSGHGFLFGWKLSFFNVWGFHI